MERKSNRVDSLEDAQKLAEKRGNEHGVLIFVYAVDGIHHAKEIADALGDLEEKNNWEARQLIRQGRKLKTMELGGITGTVFLGQNHQESVPQGGRGMGDRIINLCNQVIGNDAEHRTKRNKPVSDEWFDKADKLLKDIEMFVTQPVHLPVDAAAGCLRTSPPSPT
uniref:Uncharacterized protein n=1 Tax=Oryza barthii TaxID=65489 RepID=A0A0D3GA39_9ORYZ